MNRRFLDSFLGLAFCLIPLLVLLFFIPQLESIASGTSPFWLLLILSPIIYIVMRGMHNQEKYYSAESIKAADNEDNYRKNCR